MFLFDVVDWLLPKRTGEFDKELQAWSDTFATATEHDDQELMRRMVRRGVPDAVRGWAWARLLGIDMVSFETVSLYYKSAFSSTFGVGLQQNDVFLSHKPENQVLYRIMAIISHRYPLFNSFVMLEQVLSVMAEYFEGEEMLLAAAEKTIGKDAERRRSGDDFGLYPTRDMQPFIQLFTTLLRRQSPALSAHMAHISPSVFKTIVLNVLFDVYKQTSIPARLTECWLLEGFKVNVRFALAHVLLKEKLLLQLPMGPLLEACLLSPTDHPEVLVKTAFSLHFSRSMLLKKKKRLSLECADQGNLSSSDMFGVLPKLASRSNIITSYLEWQAVWHWLPPRFHSSILELVYTTAEHGRSLQYLFLKCALREPLLMVVECDDGTIVGAFLSKSFVCRLASKGPYGTGETFLFKLRPEIFEVAWKPDPDNHGFIYCSNEDGIAVGVGEIGHALHINRDLLTVNSHRSPVFDNPPLVPDGSTIAKIEIWSFLE